MYNAVSCVFPVLCVIIIAWIMMIVLGERGMGGWEKEALKMGEECKVENRRV
jgi:hypothetical protein